MNIVHLTECAEVIPTLAGWIVTQWGYMNPALTVETMSEKLRERIHPRHIPETFVAIEDDNPVGMASLVQYDMSSRMDLSPWLAAVYVKPEFRGRGIGSKVVQTIMDEAKTLKCERFYLFTPDKMHFYRYFGWKEIEQAEYRGERVTIMEYKILSGEL